MRFSRYGAITVMLAALVAGRASAEQGALFTVTQTVINPGLEGFTATVDNIGNVAGRGVGSAFEPPQWRDKFMVTEGHATAVIASDADISAQDRLREGFLDGADVMVFRVVNRKMTLVRRDKVKENGHAASGWRSSLGSSTLIAPSSTRMQGGFEDWNRPDTDYWFAVSAVDTDGRESAPSTAVQFKRRAKPGKSSAQNQTVTIKKTAKTPRGVAPPPPTGLRVREDRQSGDAVLQWDAVNHPKLAGYRIWRSDYDPTNHRGFRIELASTDPSAEPLLAGDMVIVHKAILHPSRKQLLSNRVFDSHHKKDIQFSAAPDFFPDEDPAIQWRLEPHDAQTPVEDAGQTALRIELQGDKKHRYERYAFGDTQQSSRWWPVLNPAKEYVVEIWLRQQGMQNPKVQFAVEGPYRREMKPIEFEVGKDWRKHTATFRVPRLLDTAGPVGTMALSFQGPGTLWMDNYRVYEKGTPYLQLLPADEEALRTSAMTALRSHQFIKTFRSSYNMDQLTNPAGVINSTGGNTLPQFFTILERLNLRPWLQIEFFMTPEEWLGFVEYLAAPFDPDVDSAENKPWAAKRVAQGRQAPWVDSFERIFFEISNETWNGLFSPWTFQAMRDAKTQKTLDRGTVYGLFQEWVIDQLQASPYWSTELAQKFEFVIGGWAIQAGESGYGARAVAASPRSRHMTIAAYNGGWDEGEGPATVNRDSFQRILMHAPQSAAPRARQHGATQARHLKGGLNYRLGVYEAGPGYAMSGLNNQAKMTPEEVEEQAKAMKSLAAGTATLDSFLTKAQHGFEMNNFFTWSRSRNHWHSHATWQDGGQAYPSWMAVSLFNRHATGDLLRVDSRSVPTMDMPKFKRRDAASNLPLIATYASRKADRLSVFVISRRLASGPGDDGATPVRLDLPVRSAKKLTLYRMTGDPTAHNLYDEQVKVEELALASDWTGSSLEVGPTTGGLTGGMPQASVYLYVFEAVEFTEPEAEAVAATVILDRLREFWESLKTRALHLAAWLRIRVLN